MDTYQCCNSKSAAFVTKVKRTFVLTFALVFLTLSVMYVSTGQFSSNNIQILRNVTQYIRKITRPLENSSTGHKMFTEKEMNTTVLENQNVISQSINKEISSRLAEQEQLEKLRKTNSKEFPGMPDPCSEPRRDTGIEDILCMKRPDFLPEYKNPCWMEDGQFYCLPYFHLIGICKSGTSDFFKRLLLHPDVIPNKGVFQKEIPFWSWFRFEIKKRAGKFKMGMTIKEFSRKFDTIKVQNGVDSQGQHNKITGHGDPMDIWYRFLDDKMPQNTPGTEELLWTTPFALRHINPKVKLLLMLRDPVDRVYSHYFHDRRGTKANFTAKSFHDHVVQSIGVWKTCLQQHLIRHCIYSPKMKEALKAPIYTSFYIVHLKEWLRVFPMEKFFIFRNEDYSADIKGTLRQIFKFLDVPIPEEGILDKMKSLSHFYETKKKKKAGPMMAATKELLTDLYRPYTEELASFLKDDRFSFKDRSFAV